MDLINDSELGDLALTLLISIVSLLLAFGEDVAEKQYQKKYILILYFILFFGIIFLKINYIFLILSFFLITLLSGINLAYWSDNIEIEQGRINLIKYKTLQWLYVTKLYLFYGCVIIISFYNYFFEPNNVIVQISFIVFALAYHLSSNIIDKFNVHSFSHTYNELKEQVMCFDKLYDDSSIDEKKSIYKNIAFLVYMEDKDYFSRKSFTFNVFSILKRKAQKLQLNEKKTPKIRKKILRGYSTLEQQFIRKNSMVPDSYQYKLRRKLFVELQYTKYYSKSLISYIKRVKYSDENESRNYIKVSILKWYYIIVLKSPKNLNELLNNFQSNLKVTQYRSFWEQFLLEGKDYELSVRKNFDRANKLIKEERK